MNEVHLRDSDDEKRTHNFFHKFVFFEGKPAKGGLISMLLGAISIALIIIGISLSYVAGGSGGVYVGSLALAALASAGFGIYFGFAGFKEEQKRYWSCKVGIILCACVAVFLVALYAIGF